MNTIPENNTNLLYLMAGKGLLAQLTPEEQKQCLEAMDQIKALARTLGLLKGTLALGIASIEFQLELDPSKIQPAPEPVPPPTN